MSPPSMASSSVIGSGGSSSAAAATISRRADATPGQLLVTYPAEPGSDSARALALLGSVAATEDALAVEAEVRQPRRHSP